MNQQQSEKDDLEYNDGLGDLLREKDSMQFSWAKTVSVIVVLALLITLGLWAFFKSSDNPDAHETEYANDLSDSPIELKPTGDITTDGHVENVNIKGDPMAQQEVDNSHVDEVIKKLMADKKAAQKVEQAAEAPAETAPTPKAAPVATPKPVQKPVATTPVVPAKATPAPAPVTPKPVAQKPFTPKVELPVASAPRPVAVQKPSAPKITYVKPKKVTVSTSKATASQEYYRVVAGTYASRVEADSAVMALSEHNIPGFVRPVGSSEFMVQAGAFQSFEKATQHVQLLRSKGYKARVESKR